MNERLTEYFNDPERGRARRTMVVTVVVLALAVGIWAIASARKKTPAVAAAAGAPLQMQVLADGRPALVACVCPTCGAVQSRPAGGDCEELRCPRCRTDLKTGFYFMSAGPGAAPAAAAPPPIAWAPAPAPTPAQPPALEPRERPELAPPAAGAFGAPFGTAPAMPAPLPIRPVNFIPQRPGASSACACAACGTRVPNDGHLYCPGLKCPACGRAMMAGVRVGAAPPAAAAPAPGAAAAARGELVAAQTAPCVRPAAAVTGARMLPTYGDPVGDIVQRNCLRCHGSSLRNLSTYQNLRSYASSGLLLMMIQPGGPMSHFLSPAEAQQLMDWVTAGQPR
ncbi:MAG TPA: hypothetical protein VGQ83_37605 [Polyangia bacterium]|jgi:hypothetical protein